MFKKAAASLPANGAYIYSLYVDGKLVTSKQRDHCFYPL